MRILYYNWDPLGGPAGGGVSAYLLELIGYLVNHQMNTEIWFLNSGRKYDESGELCIKSYTSLFGESVQTYEVINSPVLAAGRQSIINFEKYVYDTSLANILEKFISDKGPFDVVHFHNVEGLSLNCLKLKHKFKRTKFIISLHNYFPFCPQVNLWRNDEINCSYDDFSLCIDCFSCERYDLAKYRYMNLDIPGLKEKNLLESSLAPDRGDISVYEIFIKENIKSLNEYFDVVLCVSKRTKLLAQRAGIKDDVLQVSYAGSYIAEKIKKRNTEIKADTRYLSIIYLGYGSKEKGFCFFINTFSRMRYTLRRQLRVTVVSRIGEARCTKVKKMLEQYGLFEVNVMNGYRDYDQLECILKDQDLGIVPVLWEDNLPRVAMEQFAAGIPLLTSDLGGASELGGENEKFIFKAGDYDDYIEKLQFIAEHKQILREYFDNAIKLTTLKSHVEDLMSYYEN